MSLYIPFLIFSLLAFVVSYLASDNLYISAGVFLLFLFIGFLVFIPMLKKYKTKINKFHECYHFINNFVIALSIKKSIAGSLESTVSSMPTEFVDMYEGLENLNNNEKLNYLSTYFPFHIYHLFSQIIDLWEEQGGDILQMSKYLIAEARNNEEYINKSESLATHKYVEIGILWGFCLLIVVILRFVLKDFFNSIKSQLIYIISIASLMVFVLLSIFLLLKRGTDLKIKGYK